MRSGGGSGSLSVDYAVVLNGTTSTADFAGGVLPAGSVTFANGETSKTITINIATDLVSEANESFSVTLQNPNPAYTIWQVPATTTAYNDDNGIDFANLQFPGTVIYNIGDAPVTVFGRVFETGYTEVSGADIPQAQNGLGVTPRLARSLAMTMSIKPYCQVPSLSGHIFTPFGSVYLKEESQQTNLPMVILMETARIPV
jgi:hypothetical protein